MQLLKNADLKPLNSFGIAAKAKYLLVLENEEDFLAIPDSLPAGIDKLGILGGGSNVLFTQDFSGVLLHPKNKGISLLSEDAKHFRLRVAAGENWHDFVLKCVQNHWQGLENLSLIPGTVGAAPIQNIGAYGVEVQSYIAAVETVNVRTGELRLFTQKDCCFSYRNSIFKTKLKGKYIVRNVIFELKKQADYQISYRPLAQALSAKTVNQQTISDAVIGIRRGKLPDPADLANAGSFFKNPLVTSRQHRTLKGKFPDLVGYPTAEDTVKLAAGWLIEHAGWKGKRLGEVGTYPKQALVVVNYGKASGKEIAAYAAEIQKSVENKFGVLLEKEVNIW